MSSKQSIAIAAVSGALVAGLAVAGFFYFGGEAAPEDAVASAPAAAETVAAAGPAAAQAALPTGAQVIKDIFGIVSESGVDVATSSQELTNVWHVQTFESRGETVHAVLTKSQYVDPTDGTVIDSHATAPAISAIAYRRVGAKWEPAGQRKHFAHLGAWGDAPESTPAQLLEFPGDAVALLFDTGGSGQGYTETGKAVFLWGSGEWQDLGFIQTGGDNSGAALSADDSYAFTGTVSAVSGTERYPDLLVTRSGTQRDDSDKIVPAKNALFRLKGTQYEESTSKD